MNALTPIRPVSPAAGYIGGKRNLARRLCPLIDRLAGPGYAEPFVGMGGIFLRRAVRAPHEFINDISGDVATFFRVLQEHHAYLLNELRFRITSRAEYDRLRAIPGERLTDLQRAVRFLYVQRLAFGGKVGNGGFGVAAGQGARFNINRLEPMLADIHDRLAGVVIEQLPYADFLRRYDRADMLFYLDPPYAGSEDDYGKGVFGPADFAAIADQLGRGRARFLLSINDTSAMREAFARFRVHVVGTTYQIGEKARLASELVVTNIDIGTSLGAPIGD